MEINFTVPNSIFIFKAVLKTLVDSINYHSKLKKVSVGHEKKTKHNLYTNDL